MQDVLLRILNIDKRIKTVAERKKQLPLQQNTIPDVQIDGNSRSTNLRMTASTFSLEFRTFYKEASSDEAKHTRRFFSPLNQIVGTE